MSEEKKEFQDDTVQGVKVVGGTPTPVAEHGVKIVGGKLPGAVTIIDKTPPK
jgi:hypothetical protein